jgi:uncharacterized protein YecE (DUF72 family)
MKFGKLADISQVDFSLPGEPAANEKIMQQFQAPKEQCLLIGCTGWSMKEWVGKLYPPKVKTSEYLFYYSRQFSTIELNTTHYRIPNAATIHNWYHQSAADFRFCPKMPQSISHHRQLGIGTDYIQLFTDSISGLQEKLGVVFMQVPPYFDSSRIPLCLDFLKHWPAEIPLALEFRHESWFEPSAHVEDFFNLLATKQIGLVITDVAGRRDVLHMRITSPKVLLRFVGNGLVPSDFTRIEEWVDRWKVWYQQGIHELYCFAHEPDNILAPELGAYISEKSVILRDIKQRGPKFYEDPTKQQMTLF